LLDSLQALAQDAESAVITLLDLKAMGVLVAIDDFGTGYSSFTYLRRFPVDTLKVGQSFVQEITADPEGSTLVGPMIGFGKSLKPRIVAVGVETALQLDFLQRHECGEGQGSYFSYPVLAEQAARLFKSGVQEGMVHWLLAPCISTPALSNQVCVTSGGTGGSPCRRLRRD
jgi:diguanylate cyclase